MNETREPSLAPCRADRLLIVDDEPMIRKVFHRTFVTEFPGVTIDQAANGAEAVDLFKSGRHAVVLMDLAMPIMDGEKAYQAIQRLCQEQKWALPSVVFCTGFSPSPSVRDIVAANPKHCMLKKPVKNQLLVDTIRSRLTPPPAG